MLSLGLLLEVKTSPKKKKRQERAGDLPTESHGCGDGGIKKTSGYQEEHAQITDFDVFQQLFIPKGQVLLVGSFR